MTTSHRIRTHDVADVSLAAAAATALALLAFRRDDQHPATTSGRDGNTIRPNDVWSDRLTWARALAQQPAEQLARAASTFLGVLQNAGADDPVLWQGFGKLTQYAIDHDDPSTLGLRMRLLGVSQKVTPPSEYTALVERLRTGR